MGNSRYFYLGLLVVVVAVAAVVFSYKTPASPEATFGGVSLNIEYATTTVAKEKGLSGRVSVPDNYGMLFVFNTSGRYGFWMKDMFVPIDIFWLDDQGHVVSIAENVATSSYPNVFYPSVPARYVLETASGFATGHDIATGTPLLLKKFPSVSE